MSTNEEKIESTKSLLSSGILLSATWLSLGVISCWLVSPLAGLLFLVFSTFSILIILRRQLCNTCYYCKTCTKGFAKTAMLFLGANHIPGIGNGSLLGMAAFSYVVLTVIPAAMLVNSLLLDFSLVRLLPLVCLLSISVYSIILRIRNSLH